MKIIAETAFNHNGDIEYLMELVEKANSTGADYVTVQVMDTESFCVKDYERYDIYINTEISKNHWKMLFDLCKEKKIKLIPCVLEESSFELCYNYGFRLFKIHATDITNKSFLEKIASTESRVILETQCATLFDIQFALDILNGGSKNKVECIIHGFSDYPTSLDDLNLDALEHLSSEFNTPVGFADHTLDITEIPLMCLAKGCSYFEKHITLDRGNGNYDWQVSLETPQFKEMVKKIKTYKSALGVGIKHPTSTESSYRSVLYKKHIEGSVKMKRCDSGDDYINSQFKSFDKRDTGVAVIARLKSKRLPEKVLKKFHDNAMIVDLCNRVKKSGFQTILASSPLVEDARLRDHCHELGIGVFEGHPTSVLDRMLWLAYENKWGGVFRVTGDNPFTDPKLMKQMYQIFLEKDLDYVRVNDVPFGISAELFSTSYLWDLYLKMKNPMNSEYLSWFVLNDNNAKVGSLRPDNIDENMKFVNLSVDYQADLDRCLGILKNFSNTRFIDLELQDIISYVDSNDLMDKDKIVKLPEGKSLSLQDYLSLIEDRSTIKEIIV